MNEPKLKKIDPELLILCGLNCWWVMSGGDICAPLRALGYTWDAIFDALKEYAYLSFMDGSNGAQYRLKPTFDPRGVECPHCRAEMMLTPDPRVEYAYRCLRCKREYEVFTAAGSRIIIEGGKPDPRDDGEYDKP